MSPNLRKRALLQPTVVLQWLLSEVTWAVPLINRMSKWAATNFSTNNLGIMLCATRRILRLLH